MGSERRQRSGHQRPAQVGHPGQRLVGQRPADQDQPHLRADDQKRPGLRGRGPPAGAVLGGRPGGQVTQAVSTDGLTKQFRGGQLAVDHVDLAVPRGSVYGFLGPNGSGKTTTIRMLLGLAYPTSGQIELLGQAMPAATVQVLPRGGGLIEGPAFYPFLSGRDNLARVDAADRAADPRSASQRIDAALDRVGLLPAAGKRSRNYSLRMQTPLGPAA